MITVKAFGSSSKGNSYLIKSGKEELLLDAGLGYRELAKHCGFDMKAILGVLISHSHRDHTKAVNDLLKAGIPCYMHEATAEELDVQKHHMTRLIIPQTQIRIGTFHVLPFSLEHDVVCMGYLITDGEDKLVYITDSYYCRYTFSGLTHILIEANHSYKILEKKVLDGELEDYRKRRLIQSHFALENVIKFLKSMDLSAVREIMLIHLSDANSDAIAFKVAVAEATGKLVTVAES